MAYADSRLVQVDIVDRDTGAPLRVWRDHGRPVVAGRPGARYAVRITNRTGERVLAVVAIDGVNIVTGQTAASDQDGYVLAPYEHASLTGWRKSHTEVADFEFTALENSYAARTGRPDDVGVIGVAVFRARSGAPATGWRRPRPSAPRRARARMRPSRKPTASTCRRPPPPLDGARRRGRGGRNRRGVGTRRGRCAPGEVAAPAVRPPGHRTRRTRILVRVTDTAFDRLTAAPEEVVRIRYDSFANLVAAGIVPRGFAQAQPYAPRGISRRRGAGLRRGSAVALT